MVIVIVAIAIAVIANIVAITLPVFLTVLAYHRHLTESQSGLFAMAEMGGIALGSVLCALVPHIAERLTLRGTTALGLMMLVAANLLITTTTAFGPFLLFSLAAGIGAGIVNAVLYAILAVSDGSRSVAFFSAAQLGGGALGVGMLADIAARFGGDSLFLTLATAGAFALCLTAFVPRHIGHLRLAAHGHGAGHPPPAAGRSISPLGWLAVTSLFTYFSGTGAVYGFLGYMGEAWGGRPQDVATAISAILAISMVATLIVAAIGSRFGFIAPLALGIGGSMLAMVLFILVKPMAGYLAVAGLFYFCVNAVTPYLFDALTTLDRSSSAAMMMGAALQGGVAFGPAVAGYMVTPDYVLINSFALGVTAFSGVILLLAIRLHHATSRPRGLP